MNRRQKNIVRDFASVIIITVVAVVGMISFKDWVNRSEAMRAMEHLSQAVLQYKKDHGAAPAESYIDSIKGNLPGHARLGKLNYRAQWIEYDPSGDEILAYTQTSNHSPFLEDDFIVLRLNGNVELIEEQKFKKLLAVQQSHREIEMLKNTLQKTQ